MGGRGQVREDGSMTAAVVESQFTIGSATVRVRAADGLGPAVDALEAAFREVPGDLHDGSSVWLGWGPFGLVETGPDEYVVTSPNYPGDVRQGGGTDDLTLALWALVGQVALLRTVDVEGADTSYEDRVILTTRSLDAPVWSMTRSPARPGDSGWFVDVFGADDAASLGPEDMVAFPAAELLHLRRDAVRVLLLPPGYAAVVPDTGIEAIIRESDRTVVARGDAL